MECGGYRKDYKWRPFGETSFVPNKPAAPPKPKKDVAIRTNAKPIAAEAKVSSPIETEKPSGQVKDVVQELKKDDKKDDKKALSPEGTFKENVCEKTATPVVEELESPDELFDFDEEDLSNTKGPIDLQDVGMEDYTADSEALGECSHLQLHREHAHEGEGLHVLLVRNGGHRASMHRLIAVHRVDVARVRIDTVHGSRIG